MISQIKQDMVDLLRYGHYDNEHYFDNNYRYEFLDTGETSFTIVVEDREASGKTRLFRVSVEELT